MSSLRELRDARVAKLGKLRSLGVDPYPAKSYRDTSASEVSSRFDSFEGKSVVLAGRAVSLRCHGSIIFIDLKDASGKVVKKWPKKINLFFINQVEPIKVKL